MGTLQNVADLCSGRILSHARSDVCCVALLSRHFASAACRVYVGPTQPQPPPRPPPHQLQNEQLGPKVTSGILGHTMFVSASPLCQPSFNIGGLDVLRPDGP